MIHREFSRSVRSSLFCFCQVSPGPPTRRARRFAKRVSHAAMPTRGAITYLAQERHSSYGRDSIGLLKVSVASLCICQLTYRLPKWRPWKFPARERRV